VSGPEHDVTLDTVSGFGSVYQREGKCALAETYAEQALAGRRHALGAEHPDTMSSEADLALAYLSQGKFVESELLAREALEAEEKVRPTTGSDTAPRACWARAWRERRSTPMPSPCCCSKPTRGCWPAKTISPPPIAPTWTSHANGWRKCIKRGANRRKRRSGRRSKISQTGFHGIRQFEIPELHRAVVEDRIAKEPAPTLSG